MMFGSEKVCNKKECTRKCSTLCLSAFKSFDLSVFSLIDDSFESIGLVHSEVSEHLTVDYYSCLMQGSHELAIAESFESCCCVDTLNPQGTEATFFVFAVTISILQTFLPSILGNGPNVTASAEITSGEAQNLFSTVA